MIFYDFPNWKSTRDGGTDSGHQFIQLFWVVLGSVPEEVSKSHRFFRGFNHDFFHQSRGLTMGHMGCNIRIDNGWLIDDYMGLYCTIQYIGDCHGPAWEILLTVDQVGFEHCSVMCVSLNCPI